MRNVEATSPRTDTRSHVVDGGIVRKAQCTSWPLPCTPPCEERRRRELSLFHPVDFAVAVPDDDDDDKDDDDDDDRHLGHDHDDNANAVAGCDNDSTYLGQEWILTRHPVTTTYSQQSSRPSVSLPHPPPTTASTNG
ncbi:hypothetical protein FA95DRAFT_1560109 [Auriscalpium vulgare]|uniref:Uncharacterized protein n=1 Tax=Auriscalpium vulgare TaxID=40419 RepID=A0ACB8RRU3_9AGAM|nr:hypothetical protein FA95DRAFT_1560109 [Auriscalpium vulgare]